MTRDLNELRERVQLEAAPQTLYALMWLLGHPEERRGAWAMANLPEGWTHADALNGRSGSRPGGVYDA